MGKTLISALIVVAIFSTVFVPVDSCGSVNITDAQVSNQTSNLITPWPDGTTLPGVLEALCWRLMIFTVPVFAIIVIIGGYYYMFGGSNPQRRSMGKKTLMYGFLGFFILLLACVVPAAMRGMF